MRNTRRAEAGTGQGPRGNFTPPQRPGVARAGGAPDPVAAEPPQPADPGGRWSMRNWRMATRLNVILLVPVLVALVFGGFRVNSSRDTWRQAQDAVRTANLVRAAAAYSTALINERDISAVPLLAGRLDDPAVTAARAATDDAAKTFDDAAADIPHEADLERRMANFRQVEPQLSALRKAAFTRQLPGVQTEEWYVKIQHPLMELANELGYGTSNITAYGRTLYAISLAKAAESLTRSIGTHILVEKPVPPRELAQQQTALGSYQYLQGIALEEYRGGGTAADQARLQAAVSAAQQKGQAAVADAQRKAEAAHTAFVVPPELTRMVAEIGTPGRTAAQLRAEGITADSYFQAATLSFDAYRTVEVALAGQAAHDARKIADNARRDAIVNSAIVVAALILAFVLAAMMARSMSRNMRRLRGAAFDIAETRLPALVDQLSRTDPGRVDTQVAPIPINTRDEIGEVARAFDQVHREAVRLAAEQALLRGNVNAIFTNLSLRNQGLIERQLSLITELENNEADPEQLAHLFQMDHLATRMRRNGENLLVLAGEDTARQWNQPVPLVDVMRAAASEVEAYDRIELVGIPDTEIHGSTVTDLVHLLAELLENATAFSSPQTKVRVTATRLPDGRVMVEIHDRGIGLTPADFADINHKLANPPTVDVEVAKRMGLFVVGRLADRHGIRVQLRPSGEQAGTTSLVMLPEPITRGGGGEEPQPEEDRDFTVSRIVPEHDEAAAEAGRRTAAELGFDDSRYDSLNPVGRSLMREERRAQLEAAAGSPRQEAELPHQRQEPDGYGEQPYEGGNDGQAGDRSYQEPYQPDAFGQSYDPAYQQQAYEQGFQAGRFTPQDPAAPAYGQQDTGYGQGGHGDGDGYGRGYGQEGLAYEQGAPGHGQDYARDYPQDYARDYPQQADSFEPDPADYEQNGFTAQSYESGYPGQSGYQAQSDGYPDPQGGWPATDPGVTESVPPLPQAPRESVISPSLTDAGLPRRERRPSSPSQEQPQEHSQEQSQQPAQEPAQQPAQEPAREPVQPRAESQPGEIGWRSTNDEKWQRAGQVREPKAGGVTPSGLPRRVPRANLVPGAATQTPQGGPQVSRAPEDVRGRLSNLRRGVQQGRTAGTDTNGQATDSRFGGPQNQER